MVCGRTDVILQIARNHRRAMESRLSGRSRLQRDVVFAHAKKWGYDEDQAHETEARDTRGPVHQVEWRTGHFRCRRSVGG